MVTKDYKKMTNEELKLELRKLENEFNTKKEKVASLINTIVGLDKAYKDASEELKSRTNNGGYINA